MNHIVVVGELKDDARIVDGKYRFLSCTIIQRKEGYGQNSGKVFKRFFKGVAFGKDIDQLVSQLKKGTWVEAAGEADAEAYTPRDGGEARGVVVVKGQIKPLVTQDSPVQSQALARAAAAPAPVATAPAAEEDIPF